MSEWNETCSQAPANKVIAELRAELAMLRLAHSETELNSITEIMRLGAALDQTTGERDALRGVLQEVRSLMHSDSVMSGRRWCFSSAWGERVNQVCAQVFAVLENSSPQSPALSGVNDALSVPTELAAVTAERDALRGALVEIYATATRTLAEPPCADVSALIMICTILEALPSPQSPAPAPEGPECPACDDGLVWHEKEPEIGRAHV